MASFVYDTAKQDYEEGRKIAEIEHNAEIVATRATMSKNDNPMVDLRWKIVDGNDTDKIVFDRLTFSANAIFRIDQFCKALGLDPAKEFGGQSIDIAFLVGWAEKLIGECATIKVRMGKASQSDDGEIYPPRPEVAKYSPYGSAKSVGELLDIG